MIRILLELREDEVSAAFADQLERIQTRLDQLHPGEDWIKVSLLNRTVNARVVAIERGRNVLVLGPGRTT